jgi:hypothetical protein
MHEELENFERNQVWTLVEPPRYVNIIGTKLIFKNEGASRPPCGFWRSARMRS